MYGSTEFLTNHTIHYRSKVGAPTVYVYVQQLLRLGGYFDKAKCELEIN
jgi:hypothetical protein